MRIFFLSFFGGSYFDQVAETTVPFSALKERSDSLKSTTRRSFETKLEPTWSSRWPIAESSSSKRKYDFFFVKRSCGFTGGVANKQCFHDALRDTGPLKSPGDQSSKWRVSPFVLSQQ